MVQCFGILFRPSRIDLFIDYTLSDDREVAPLPLYCIDTKPALIFCNFTSYSITNILKLSLQIITSRL